MKKKNKSIPRKAFALAAIEAKTMLERGYWNEARERSFALVSAAEDLNKYLTGASGNPASVNTLRQEVDAVYFALHAALAIRASRYEEKEKARVKSKAQVRFHHKKGSR